MPRVTPTWAICEDCHRRPDALFHECIAGTIRNSKFEPGSNPLVRSVQLSSVDALITLLLQGLDANGRRPFLSQMPDQELDYSRDNSNQIACSAAEVKQQVDEAVKLAVARTRLETVEVLLEWAETEEGQPWDLWSELDNQQEDYADQYKAIIETVRRARERAAKKQGKGTA